MQTFDTTVPFRKMGQQQFYQQTGYRDPREMRRACEQIDADTGTITEY